MLKAINRKVYILISHIGFGGMLMPKKIYLNDEHTLIVTLLPHGGFVHSMRIEGEIWPTGHDWYWVCEDAYDW